MNVYDFDKTIYDGDSTVDFYWYCLHKRPGLISCIPWQIWGTVQYAAGRIDTKRFKEYFFCFLSRLPSPEALAEEFWNTRQKGIKTWYLEQQQSNDLVISASPTFLLIPVCKRLGIAPPIGTEMDPTSGRIIGTNCKGEEKVRRFRKKYPKAQIEGFYSDSMTDAPLAKLAKEAVLVQGDKRTPWPIMNERR